MSAAHGQACLRNTGPGNVSAACCWLVVLEGGQRLGLSVDRVAEFFSAEVRLYDPETQADG